MLSEQDRNNFYNGKKQFELKCLYKRNVVRKIDDLIFQVDKILEVYKKVTFDNAIETAFLQGGKLVFEEQKWSLLVDNYLCETFRGYRSDIQTKLAYVFAPDAISEYAKARWRLVEKRKMLIEFKNALETF